MPEGGLHSPCIQHLSARVRPAFSLRCPQGPRIRPTRAFRIALSTLAHTQCRRPPSPRMPLSRPFRSIRPRLGLRAWSSSTTIGSIHPQPVRQAGHRALQRQVLALCSRKDGSRSICLLLSLSLDFSHRLAAGSLQCPQPCPRPQSAPACQLQNNTPA